jgi:hypothetical protein
MSRSRSSTYDLGRTLGVVEHAVAHLHLPDVLPHGDHLGPAEPAADSRGRRDHDPGGGTALTAVLRPHEHAVVQHPDREPGLVAAHAGG